jgi:protein-S-isoprenylcysteine O-methyltransferase Ste14
MLFVGRRTFRLERRVITKQSVRTLAVAIFTIVVLLCFLHLFMGYEVMIGGIIVPMWSSILGTLIAAGMAVMLLRESRERTTCHSK